MPARRRKKNKRWLKWFLLLILVAAAAVVSYLVWDGYFRENEPTEPEAGQSTRGFEIQEDKKKSETTMATPVREATEKEKVVQYEGEDPNEMAETTGALTGAVTYAGINGKQLLIRVNIDQYLSHGTCILTLRQNGANAYSETATIIDAASTATCEGFNVPTEGLPSGLMEIVVYVSSGEKSGEIHGEVEI